MVSKQGLRVRAKVRKVRLNARADKSTLGGLRCLQLARLFYRTVSWDKVSER